MKKRAPLHAVIRFIAAFFLLPTPLQAETANPDPTPLIQQFIAEIAEKHGFDKDRLDALFATVKIQAGIIKTMSAPAEAKPWYSYRKIFLTDSRIEGGVKFWRDNEAMLSKIADQYGVPEEIIVAILGVETRYGGHTGTHRVIDSLSTLAFGYPQRSRFFRSELEQFLLLCREEGVAPESIKGSYAGAMGLPQFIPSSYRHYAADYDGDNRRDLWTNPADAAASIANYFSKHGWRTGESVTYPVEVEGDSFTALLDKDLKPSQTRNDLIQRGVKVPEELPGDSKAKLLRLENSDGPSFWLGLHNFYVITRYNHSAHYAMAVFQLSREIRARRGDQNRS